MMKPNRIIVAGGCDFSDIELMSEKLDHLLQKRSPAVAGRWPASNSRFPSVHNH